MEYVVGALGNEDIGCPLFVYTDKILFSRKEINWTKSSFKYSCLLFPTMFIV